MTMSAVLLCTIACSIRLGVTQSHGVTGTLHVFDGEHSKTVSLESDSAGKVASYLLQCLAIAHESPKMVVDAQVIERRKKLPHIEIVWSSPQAARITKLQRNVSVTRLFLPLAHPWKPTSAYLFFGSPSYKTGLVVVTKVDGGKLVQWLLAGKMPTPAGLVESGK